MAIRLFDILLSGIALLVLAPLLLPVALILRFTGEREVFFRQQRVGKDGVHFGLLKFATMLKASPNIGSGLITLRNDPRVLPVGRVLRKTKINELPQLLNVLKGDMSLIGPRPQAPKHFDVFPEHVKQELIKVRPGLSGIGSIVFSNEEAMLSRPGVDPEHMYRDVIAPYKGELEIWFIRHQSGSLYGLLILLTVWVVFTSNHSLVWRMLPSLPRPPAEMAVDGNTG